MLQLVTYVYNGTNMFQFITIDPWTHLKQLIVTKV
jgi:hypothetical protein